MGKYALIAAAAIGGTVLAAKGLKKWSDHNKKKKAAGSPVQKKYDALQQAKASYSKNKSADNKAALQQAQKSYDNAQKAYMQKYKKPFKVDMKVEAKDKTKKKDLGKETVKSAKANLKEVKKQYKNAEKSAKNHAKAMGEYAKEMARENGASKKEQKKAYQDAYNEAIKTNKKLNKAKKNLSAASEGVKSAKNKQSTSKQSNNGEKAKTSGGQNTWNSLVAGFQNARARVSGINQQIMSSVSSSWANMKASVSAHASGSLQAAQGKWAALKANTAASFSNIRTSMSTKMASAKQAVGNHLAAIRAAFSSKLSGAAGAVRGAMSNVKRAFQNALNGIKNWVRNKLAEIRNLFAHPIQATVNVVQNMIGGKGGGKKAKGHAKGGFTNGLAIAGEDPHYPVEAVISFNPAYRKKNIEYWERAGRMLGVYQNSADAQSYLNAVSNIPSYKPSTGDVDTNLDLSNAPAQQYSEQVSTAAQTYAAYNQPNRLGDYDYGDFSTLGLYSSVVSNTQEMYDSMSGSSLNALGDYDADDFSKLGTERPTYSASIGRSLFNGDINFPLADTVGYQQESTQTQRVDVGGITIAPTINVPKGTADITAETIVDLLRGYGPEFTDMVVEKIQERMNGRYVTA